MINQSKGCIHEFSSITLEQHREKKSYSIIVVKCCCCCSVAQLCPTLCDPVDCSQHTRPSCPSPSCGACSNSRSKYLTPGLNIKYILHRINKLYLYYLTFENDRS